MTEYDASAFRDVASSLYSRAVWILFTNTLFFAVVAGIGGASWKGQGMGLIGFVVGGLLGYYFASQRALQLKYQAHTALCQAQIEEQTRALLGRLQLSATGEAKAPSVASAET